MTYFLFFKDRLSLKIIIILIFIIIGLLSANRVVLEDSRFFLGINDRYGLIGDVVSTNISTPIRSGFITKCKVISIVNPQYKTESNYNGIIISKKSIEKGILFLNVKFKIEEDIAIIYLDKNLKGIFITDIQRLKSTILKAFSRRIQSPLLLALLIGNKNQLQRDQLELFTKSGCAHILALSGFHVGVIALILITLFRIFFSGNKVLLLSILSLMFFLMLVGSSASLLRSVLMFSIGIFFRINKNKVSIYNIVIISFIILIILVPSEFYSLSFQLSYLALLGILIIGTELNRLPLVQYLPLIIRLPIIASFSSIISTSIITFNIFGEIYLVGIIASLIITPIISIFMILGIVSTIFNQLEPIISMLERIIFSLVKIFSTFSPINQTDLNSTLFILIISLIPAILLIVKLIRRINVRRFNTEFKL